MTKPYFDVIETFFNSKVSGMRFDDFYDNVGAPTYQEATTAKQYPPDGRFFMLLNFRYLSFLRNRVHYIELPISLTEPLELFICRTSLEKATCLIDAGIKRIEEGDISDKQCTALFIKIADKENIKVVQGIRIEDLEFIQRASGKTSQNRNGLARKGRENLTQIVPRIISSSSIQESISIDTKAQDLFKELFVPVHLCIKEIEQDVIKEGKVLFKYLLLCLKASYVLKYIIEFDITFAKAKYNYGSVLRKIGKFDAALIALNEAKELVGANNKLLSAITESIGCTFLLKGDLSEAVSAFKKALKLNPNDTEIVFNLLEAYTLSNNTEEIDNTLSLLHDFSNKGMIRNDLLIIHLALLDNIIDSQNKSIALKAFLLKTKKI